MTAPPEHRRRPAAPTPGADALPRQRIRGLYAITPADTDSERLAGKVRAVLEGGAAALQYRPKELRRRTIIEQGTLLRELCREFGRPFIVNDSVELALRLDADGVHLGRDDDALATAREMLPDRIIGASCYNDFSLAGPAIAQGADYVAFGSFFPSATKPDAAAADPQLLAAARNGGLNTVAIGGITPANAATLVAAGADAIAVVGALFCSESLSEIRAAAQAFAQLFETSPPC